MYNINKYILYSLCLLSSRLYMYIVYVVLLELEETKQLNLCNDLYIEYSINDFFLNNTFWIPRFLGHYKRTYDRKQCPL